MACSSCVPVTAILRALRSSTASASLADEPSKVTSLAIFSVMQAMSAFVSPLMGAGCWATLYHPQASPRACMGGEWVMHTTCTGVHGVADEALSIIVGLYYTVQGRQALL